MTVANKLPPQSFLLECFEHFEDGNLIWKSRPRCHFPTTHGHKVFLTVAAGELAWYVGNRGYAHTKLLYLGEKINLLTHRIIWTMHNGEIPEGYLVDHEDTDRLNNRIGNLRLALPTNSMSNTNLRSDNTSGVKGVSWDKQRGLWIARVYANRKKYYAGHHSSIEAASIAIETMRNSVHGEFANHGKVFIISN